jgi:glucokinase
MNQNKPYAIGVDLGGTKVAVALVEREGTIRYKIKSATVKSDLLTSVNQIADLAREAIERSSLTWADIEGLGMCIPGIYFPENGAAWAPNVWGDEQVALRHALENEIPAKAVIDSDRVAYVIGEQWMGVAQGLSDVVFVAVGTGIGAGIITGGRICRGAADIAGAVGWFALGPGKNEPSRQTGSFEYEAAGPAVARKAIARVLAGESSSLHNLADGKSKEITTELVVREAADGDALARGVLDETAVYLGMGIANIISILNPQVIVLGGGLMNAGELMLERIRYETALWAQPLAAQGCRIELTRLDDNAGLLGAARLVFLEQNK